MTRAFALGVALVASAGCNDRHENVTAADAAASDSAVHMIDAASNICGASTEAPLDSVDDVKTALHSTTAFPYPGGWTVCQGLDFCQDPNPAMSFDTDVAMAECGQNYEHGFESSASYPLKIVELGAGSYELDIATSTDELLRYTLTAFGPAGAPTALRLTSVDTQAGSGTIYVPLPSLP